ncbi:diguanylate cyclase domain-containing protein [Sphingopyxis sp.]|uniref:sensor domain-containing diguanylate cyclase n=1 Tax=Sphingopyxis sp. TaxID=1908224 RepID=UPI0035B15DFA
MLNGISADGFRALLANVPDGFFIHDETGHILDLSERCSADLGYTREELLQMSILDISDGLAGKESPGVWRGASAGFTATYRDVTIHRDGTRLPVEVRLACQTVDGCKLFLGVALDIVEREDMAMDGADTLREAYERLSLAAAGGGLGIWDYDIVRDEMRCDPQWYRIMGLDPARAIRSIAEFRALIHPEDAERATEVYEAARRAADSDENYGPVFRIVRPDGEVRWIRSAASVVRDREGAPIRAAGFVVDITDAHHATASLRRQTLEDPLTGLANRRHFDDELRRACLHATRTGEPLTLAMIDVDHFKLYNDEQGHVRGDEALRSVADILKAAARRPYDLAARYGGEEFLLLLPGAEQPAELVGRIVEAVLALGIPHRGSPVVPHLTVSCGCVTALELADLDPLDLIAACDSALYRAKADGRNRIHLTQL